MATLDLNMTRTYDNRDAREVGREAAARGEALLAELKESQRVAQWATSELFRSRAEYREEVKRFQMMLDTLVSELTELRAEIRCRG